MKRKGLGFYAKIYCKILAQDLKSKMSYRADFIISTVGMICTNIAGFISFCADHALITWMIMNGSRG